jgi:HSP20 family molecular chaperone IbpA
MEWPLRLTSQQEEVNMNSLSRIREKLTFLTQDHFVSSISQMSHTILSFDLPNMKPDDFDISVDGKSLLISVKKHHAHLLTP